MTTDRMYDLFISHAWRYHNDWTRLTDILDRAPGVKWRNFSLPWHDPALDPNSPLGGKLIRDSLETQIIPVHGVILLAGVYAIKSARRWLDLEVEIARKYNKPIIGIPAIGASAVPEEVRSLSNASAIWDAGALIATLDLLCGETQKSPDP
jgi:Thoeris protein ThsB, TIR-like domain